MFKNLTFKLGLYPQYDALTGKKFGGLGIQAYEDGMPYATVTVNIPGVLGVCEMIGIKNAAYVDINNCPWVTEFLTEGIAEDTGFTRRSGFCEYPLYVFNEEWLKSVDSEIYKRYENDYNRFIGAYEEEDEE